MLHIAVAAAGVVTLPLCFRSGKLSLLCCTYRISDDRKSLIDVEDQDMQVDYEQFAKMLLGAAL